MDEAVAFFRTVFGTVTILQAGRLDADDGFMVRRLGTRSGAVLLSQSVLDCGQGSLIELFAYQGSVGPGPERDNSAVGAFHLAFQVDDADAAAKRLGEAGVDLLDGPTLIEAGPMAGLTWIYLRAPWGLSLELMSMTPHSDGTPRAIWKTTA